jgi:hypothetical protein
MTLMKSIVSLHQGPKVSKAKPLNMQFDEIIERMDFMKYQLVYDE